jgi:hypothetical protein
LQPKAQLYFARALKIYFQKTRQIIIENAKHFAKTDKSLLGHPPRGTTQLSLIKWVVKGAVGENTNCGTEEQRSYP